MRQSALILLAFAAVLVAQRPLASFDYYVLSLSWAPAFCAQPGEAARNPQECATGKGIGFIVHGLWPEATQGKSPEACEPATPVSKAAERIALPYMFSAGLIQHEWQTHGECTGLAQVEYFSSIVQARSAVQIPVQITSVDHQITESPGQIETQFADANPAFSKTAFRTSCPGAVFQEERVCFDKNLKPRACTASVGECISPAITIRPPL